MNATSRLLTALLLAAALPCAAATVRSLTSNDLTALAGSGDTLWLTTSAGLNTALDTAESTMAWRGWETAATPWSPAFGEGVALASLSATNDVDRASTTFWVYNHASDSARSRTLVWSRGASADMPLLCYAAVRSRGYWWMACSEAGLARWDGVAGVARLLIPGRAATRTDTAVDAAVMGKPLTSVLNVQTQAAGGDTLLLWVATPARVWRLTATAADTVWDSLPWALADSTRLRFVQFVAVHLNASEQPARVFASISVRVGGDTATGLFRYESGAWHRMYGLRSGQGSPRGVSFAPGNCTYVADSSQLALLRDSLVACDASVCLADRMRAATSDVDWNRLVRSDVLATRQTDSTVRLWVATSEGFFFAHDVRPTDLSSYRFHFAKRSPAVKSGLEQTYAYPGILAGSPDTARVRFAYNLGEAATVTIRVYDCNMDLVRTVTSAQRRQAGASRPSRRSSEPADAWDGRNEAGRVVAPGVYYYKISTSSGGRAFGKIVVALSR